MTIMKKKTTYCYQGVPGCYSEQACIGVSFKNHKIPTPETQECRSFPDVFQAVIRKDFYGVIPVENSLGGSIHENFDLIQTYHQEIEVIQEYNLRIEHCLLALPGISINEIERVESHPQALAQCRETLSSLFSDTVDRIPIHDTAYGAKNLQEKSRAQLDNDPTLKTAIIASREAAQRYGLTILRESIEDNPQNYTRFWVIRKRPDRHVGTFQIAQKTTNRMYKHSILFSLDHKAGSLSKILSIFSVCNANLTKIESRPIRNPQESGHPFQYWFFVDFVEELPTDSSSCVIPMIVNLQGIVVYQFKSLGIYPYDETIYVPQHSLRVGIVGGGTFGQCIAKLLDSTHHIMLTSRSDYSAICKRHGWEFYSTIDEWNKVEKDVILIAVSIDSFDAVVQKIKFQDELVVDVLSVKEFPKQVLLKNTPQSCDILATHPMFGPNSIRAGNLPPFILEKIRIGNTLRCQYFLESISNYCRLVEMSCEKHDQELAIYQSITHYVNRILDQSGFTQAEYHKVPRSCRLLLDSIRLTKDDSDSLFYSLFKYNLYAKRLLKSLQKHQETLRDQILYNEASVEKVGQNFFNLPIKIGTNEFDEIIKKKAGACSEGEEIAELHIGEPQYRPPDSVYQLMLQVSQQKERIVYTSIKGTQSCRQSIIDHYQMKGIEFKLDEVICCNGGKQAIYQALLTLTDQPPTRGSSWEVVLPTPYWGPYQKMVASSQAKLVYVETTAEEEYQINIKTLHTSLNSNSRILILCSPHNPTGVIYTKECLKGIARLCDIYRNLHIIWDEIYSDLILDKDSYDDYPSLIKIAPHLRDRIITINGFSKTYAMTGFRIGYALGRKEIITKMAYYQGQITSSAGELSQRAGSLCLEAYRDTNYVDTICRGLAKNASLLINCFQKINRIVFTKPKGGMYIYVNLEGVGIRDSYNWCCEMVAKYGVAFMPGNVFGDSCGIRICFAVGKPWIRRVVSLFQKEFGSQISE